METRALSFLVKDVGFRARSNACGENDGRRGAMDHRAMQVQVSAGPPI
jgi:hypothetical protein